MIDFYCFEKTHKTNEVRTPSLVTCSCQEGRSTVAGCRAFGPVCGLAARLSQKMEVSARLDQSAAGAIPESSYGHPDACYFGAGVNDAQKLPGIVSPCELGVAMALALMWQVKPDRDQTYIFKTC